MEIFDPTLLTALIFGGLVAGLIAGLFGVGGGTVSVPVLVALFSALHYHDSIILKLAIGTSLAVLTPTAAISFWGHWRKGAVETALLKKLALPVLGGVIIGSWLASFLAPVYLKTLFSAITILFGIKFLTGYQIKGHAPQTPLRFTMPSALITGTSIGTLSVLMGIGGGLFGNMFFTLMGYDIRRSVATSSGLGILIGTTGIIGFMLAGLSQTALPLSTATATGQNIMPPFSVGYVSFLGAALMIPTSALSAPWGVKLAHSLKPRKLEQLFGLYLIAAGSYIFM